MKRINGVTIFNGTPHPITFAVGDGIEVVGPDEKIDARPVEMEVESPLEGVQFVRTSFQGTNDGKEVIRRAKAAGADIIVGSIIAAQAYPGDVVAMIPSPGFERVPPAEKRMRADKFTVY